MLRSMRKKAEVGRMKFTIPYPKPKQMAAFCKRFGLNSIYAGKHWSKRKEDKEYWYWLIKSELAKQSVPAKIFEKAVCITFHWNDGLDCSNHAYIAKMIEDCLKGYLIKDDSRRYVAEIRHKFYDEPFITVEILELLMGGRNEAHNSLPLLYSP